MCGSEVGLYEKLTIVFFSHTKSFFGKYVLAPEPPEPGFQPALGRRAPEGGGWPSSGRRAPAITLEGARGLVQGNPLKKWRNRRVSCRPFRGVDFSGGTGQPDFGGASGSYPIACRRYRVAPPSPETLSSWCYPIATL